MRLQKHASPAHVHFVKASSPSLPSESTVSHCSLPNSSQLERAMRPRREGSAGSVNAVSQTGLMN